MAFSFAYQVQQVQHRSLVSHLLARIFSSRPKIPNDQSSAVGNELHEPSFPNEIIVYIPPNRADPAGNARRVRLDQGRNTFECPIRNATGAKQIVDIIQLNMEVPRERAEPLELKIPLTPEAPYLSIPRPPRYEEGENGSAEGSRGVGIAPSQGPQESNVNAALGDDETLVGGECRECGRPEFSW
ncbi:hypothetical protein NA57DRAFT_72228 [Rhizodiscina lignyota]|uniref:Uncharacterized protein n=1 Tax=Rhizodiscina lignyota TaxID=1504668 RepID=A0A9P4INT5_9PEZI|nr:hypothetical protein NA57DRAFT_72228 [Rhizodiscina lignyota]